VFETGEGSRLLLDDWTGAFKKKFKFDASEFFTSGQFLIANR
jgi:hypothetical protein